MFKKSINNTAISSVFGELKYRTFYVGLVLTSLIVLIYLNLGLYIEFQGSYYLSYYEFIDFDWCQGIKDLNSSINNKTLFKNLNKISKNASTQNKVNEYCLNDFSYYSGFQCFLQNNKPVVFKESVDSNILCDSQNLFTCFYSPETNSTTIEIDEFKPFFIEIVSFFSGQATFLINVSGNIDVSEINNQQCFTAHHFFFDLYFVCVFYQLVLFFIYQCFCFICAAFLKKNRLKLVGLLLFMLSILLVHFIILPYTIVIDQELRIESLDSELFFSTALNLLDSWIKCFYIVLALLFLFFGAIYARLKINCITKHYIA